MICAACNKKLFFPFFRSGYYFFCIRHKELSKDNKTITILESQTHSCFTIDDIVNLATHLSENGIINYIKTDMKLNNHEVQSTLSLIILKSQLKVVRSLIGSTISISQK